MGALGGRHVSPASTDRRRWVWLGLGIVALLVLVAGAWALWGRVSDGRNEATVVLPQSLPDAQSSERPQSEPEPEPELPPAQFTVVAGGDILLHNAVYWASQNEDGRYDLSRLLEPTAPYIQGADLAICQMEVPIVMPGGELMSYPLFAAPYETAEELKEAGWDGCTTASNHSVDTGFAGLANTLDRFDEAGLGHVGTARTPEESQEPQFYQIEKDGQTLTVANIAFANNLNGLPLPEEQPWSINLNDVQMVIDQARQARENGADLVIVAYHCCDVEYTSIPEDLQVATAQTLAESGVVDIMISHHAHVPKPMDRLAGGPTGEGMWVAYGTGNFISNQSEHCCVPESNVGVLLYFDVVKAADGTVTVPEASWSAVMTERTFAYNTRVITADGAEGSPVPLEEIQWRHQLTVDVMGSGLGAERSGPPSNPGTTAVIPRS